VHRSQNFAERLAGSLLEVDHAAAIDEPPMCDYSDFAKYMETQNDLDPLYVFDR